MTSFDVVVVAGEAEAGRRIDARAVMRTHRCVVCAGFTARTDLSSIVVTSVTWAAA
jgi:hypothetical protein